MSLWACTRSFMIQSYELLLKRLAKKVESGEEFNRDMLQETINEIIEEIHR